MLSRTLFSIVCALSLSAGLFAWTGCEANTASNETPEISASAESEASQVSEETEPSGAAVGSVQETTEDSEPETVLTQDALNDDIYETAEFYQRWFYDRSMVIDPKYSDIVEYPMVNATGQRILYPTKADDFQSFDELEAETIRQFGEDTAGMLLASIDAQDVNGTLCVMKSDGLGGIGMRGVITVNELEDGMYGLTLDYAPVTAEGSTTSSVSVWYSPDAEEERFGGTENSINLFFTSILYMEELDYVMP